MFIQGWLVDYFFFFFSSRRRHTRLQGDWSSDVCSSDLEDLSQEDYVTLLLDIDRDYATYWQLAFDHRGRPAESCFGDKTRSEERRVGKECRYGGTRYH